MAPQWISDGSPEIKLDGNKATCDGTSPTGNVFNALWEDNGDGGVTSGQHYWKLRLISLVEHSSVFVGVTDKDKFQQGWGIKGLLYGGNLSNGSALLVGEFGPSLKVNDTVGIFVSFENDNLKVYFDINGNSLGLAFDLPKSGFKGLFPVAHFSGPGSVEIEKAAGVPNLARPAVTHVGIEGDWKLAEFKTNGAVSAIPTSVTLRLTKTNEAPESYAVGLSVINIVNKALRRQDPSSPWVAEGGMSTMMGGPPEHMALEGQMSQLTSNPTKVELDGTALVWDGSSMSSRWERYTITKSPVTANPFN